MTGLMHWRWLAALFVVGAVILGLVALTNRQDKPSATGTPSLHWFDVPVTSPRSIAAENKLAGTRSWELVGATKPPRLALYVSSQSAAPGDTERVYVDSPDGSVELSMYRIGWYGGQGGRLVLSTGSAPTARQPPCTHRVDTGLTECRWIATSSFQLPAGLTSGVYVIKAHTPSGQEREALIVVAARAPAQALVQIPIATYEAYNAWGGDSLYPESATNPKQGVDVSFDRPYDGPTGAGQFFGADVATVRFLEQRGFPVSYTANPSVAAQPQQLVGRALVLDVGHSEYWSQAEYQGFSNARDAGTNLAFLSSDTAAWRVRYAAASDASSEAGSPYHRIISYKEHATLDPDRKQPTGAFADKGATLTGSAFLNCITPRLREPGEPTYRYFTWRPNPALQPAWLFEGTGLTPNSEIPGIVGYELDHVTAQSPHTTSVGTGTAPCMARNAPGVADTTLYRAPSGANVFASGTLGWQLGLSPVPSASPDAPRTPSAPLVRLTENLVQTLISRRP